MKRILFSSGLLYLLCNKLCCKHATNNSEAIPRACSSYMGTVILTLLLITPIEAVAQQLAFPGAEGFGRYATGGRRGSVYHVTNLNDAGPGSFRDAVSQSNRTVVFDVGGIINIKERIVVKNNVTIAGQTAPGDGIVIYGDGMSFSNANNSITRYIRVRMGINGTSGKDAITIAEGHDMIFDYVSVSWGRDETFSISGDVDNVTIQNSIISQGLDTHSCGGLIQTSGGVSLLRNLYIDNNTRNPKVKGVNQFVNNLVYNWRVAAYILGDSAGDSYANVINNYFINGPSTSSAAFTRGNLNFHIYASNNYQDSNRNGILDGGVIPKSAYGTVDWQISPYSHPSVTMLSPLEAYYVVVSKVGASMPRDEVDTRLITELKSLGILGQIIANENNPPMNGPGTVNGGVVPLDTDLDGMPDDWEKALGLNPNLADNNGDINGNGYTNLEDYLNWLAAPHAKVTKNRLVDIDLRQYSSGFNPGAIYTLSDINHGIATLLDDGYTVRFMPSKGYTGLAGFRYTVNNNCTMTETVELLVTDLGEWLYGDFTGDGLVDMDDIPYFADFWLENDCNEINELDSDDNCIINFYEFSVLANNWKKPPPDINAPLAPIALWAMASDGMVWLVWDDNEEFDLSGYNIYRSINSGGGYVKLNGSLLSSSDYTDDTVINGIMYYYVVTAVDTADNESNNSVEACALPSTNGKSITLQEYATGLCNVDGVIENEHSGHTGSGYSNTDNANGKGIDWSINILSSGTYTFTWRFANGSSNRSARLSINGTTVVSSINSQSTGAWTSWREVSADVALTTGIKDIRLEATNSNGLANIDYLMVTGPDPRVINCTSQP